ncbi:MAG: spermidine synthase [Candidatus Dactylopiibacterium carminicum]|uniref:Spermidine synthase n=1 Tax=Candidatus Dactylopiibacterium carminicum TaxID=857335 RepID=A0A272EPD7_9RHOO|nr:spermidine synthase [Candidatus Dactylopiibacterium carminicum]KAF7599127.1 spermidine synthase [Candidatus Dactylopiibacterium carminicum]PAS91982.1 MAG: spermidine synthase [Candidatus Dactylopiibacterium carminicum]PAS95250.1 MAG: spermidine synthase [Candidatus Dactylopiibacterium carminicum]PAS99145.1 MAG: spermidine synthase [Candidatus Dactylopiibacterium carminicum]
MRHDSIDISEEAGVRYLHFGSEWIQGAMRIRRPVDLELEYTREMMFGLLLREGFTADARWPRNILQIGLGAGSLTKFAYWKLPQTRVAVVEIDPAVHAAACFHFKLPAEDLRLHIEIGDGVDYVLNGQREFDYIQIDGFDADAGVGALDSLPFYQACRARLSDQGLLATNFFGSDNQYEPALQRLYKAFDGRCLALPPCTSGNVIALAASGAPITISDGALQAAARTLKTSTGLDLLPSVKRLQLAFPGNMQM